MTLQVRSRGVSCLLERRRTDRRVNTAREETVAKAKCRNFTESRGDDSDR